jgi:hypothetical protein
MQKALHGVAQAAHVGEPLGRVASADRRDAAGLQARPLREVAAVAQQLLVAGAAALGRVREVDGEGLAEPLPHPGFASSAGRVTPNGNADCNR